MNAPISRADRRALLLWRRWNEQKEQVEHLLSGTSDKQRSAAPATLFAIENELRCAMRGSVLALAAVLVTQIEGEAPEDVLGLNRAALAAIRPQLMGEIATVADSVLAHVPDPVVVLVKQVRNEWDRLGEAIDKAEEVETERPDEADGILAPVQRTLGAAMDELLKTPPTTLAGASAAIAWFVEYDEPNVPKKSGAASTCER